MSSRRKLRRLSWLFFGLVPVVLVLSVYYAETQPSTAPPTPVRVAPAPSVSPSAGGALSQSPGKAETVPAQVPASAMLTMRIPAIGLSLKVTGHSLGSPIDPPFDPKTIDSLVYQDTSRGSNPGTDARNATYIVGHTWRAGHAAFNIVDTSLRVDDDIYVMTQSSKRLGVWLHYVVTRKFLYQKDTLANPSNPLWQVRPRLVLITCHLRADGALQNQNRVFFARLVGTKQK